MSYGTEGRRGNPAEEIPPSSSVYEYIVFRGSDVKDISVAEEEKKEVSQPEPPRVPDDPAILGVSDSSFLERIHLHYAYPALSTAPSQSTY
jgi:Scd6-like Sm domain